LCPAGPIREEGPRTSRRWTERQGQAEEAAVGPQREGGVGWLGGSKEFSLFPKQLRGKTNEDLTLNKNEIKTKAQMHKKKTYGCIKLYRKLSLKKLRRS
jgi:hypothetical protein